MVWCGARNGRRATSDSPSGRVPATEWIFVVSSASSRLILGKIVGRRRASIVFPEPGGPTMSMLCPPAHYFAKNESRRGTRDDEDPFGRGHPAAGRVACGTAAVPVTASHDLRRRLDRRRIVSPAGRGEPGARGRPVSRRAAGVPQERARGVAPTDGGWRGDD